mgnify:CR=1 FL=1
MTDNEKKELLQIIDSRTNSPKEFYSGVVLNESFKDDSKYKDDIRYNAISLRGASYTDNDYFILQNKTGQELKIGDSVLIHAINGDLSNGYILKKFGDDLVPIVAYEDENGINDDFAMKYSCENAKYAEIYYKDTATPANYGYTKVYNPNNKYICLSISKTNSSKNNIWIKTSTINFTDRVCWVKYFAEGDFINSTVTYINSIYVTKVILYF